MISEINAPLQSFKKMHPAKFSKNMAVEVFGFY